MTYVDGFVAEVPVLDARARGARQQQCARWVQGARVLSAARSHPLTRLKGWQRNVVLGGNQRIGATAKVKCRYEGENSVWNLLSGSSQLPP
jgi:hypothetical protein